MNWKITFGSTILINFSIYYLKIMLLIFNLHYLFSTLVVIYYNMYIITYDYNIYIDYNTYYLINKTIFVYLILILAKVY